MGFLQSLIKPAEVVEAAPRAEGVAATDIFAQADQQSMVFVKQPGIVRQTIHKERLIGIIAITPRCQTDTVDDATSISINNENWLIGSIQNYRIGCFLSNTVNGQKLLAELVNIMGKQLV